MSGDFPTREAMALHQLAQLRRLLGTILPANAFYRNKLARINPAIASLEDFSARFPFTTKQELADDQRAHPPFGSNLTFPADQLHALSSNQRHDQRALALAGHAGELELDGGKLEGNLPGGGRERR
jgi:hypothetical protein